MGCMSNPIPIFTDIINYSTQVIEFLKTNSKKIIDTLDNCLFPYSEIVNLVPPGNNTNLHRHVLHFNDLTLLSSLKKEATDEGLTLKLNKAGNVHSYSESALHVRTDNASKSTTLKLFMCAAMHSEDEANVIKGEILRLFDEMVLGKDFTIADLKNLVMRKKP
ncbi:hypothetical protein SNE40_012576 [Patella caerulea]|uniref:Uncharacterized protein n=1 Tax=Patella caerulea TaxID=87958 RepID=A0AAN8JPS0_PATCE